MSRSEDWRVIPEYDDYEVSSLGRVRRATPDRNGRNQGLVLKLRSDSVRMTTQVGLTLGGRQKQLTLPRVVCSVFHGPNSTHLAHHINGDWQDNRACNLAWVESHQDISDAMVSRGTHSHGDTHMSRTKPHTLRRGDDHPARYSPDYLRRGQTHPLAKLTEDDIIDIRASSQDRGTLARQYGVEPNTIRAIKLRKTWKHI